MDILVYRMWFIYKSISKLKNNLLEILYCLRKQIVDLEIRKNFGAAMLKSNLPVLIKKSVTENLGGTISLTLYKKMS